MLEDLFKRFAMANLAMNLSKPEFGQARLKFLGTSSGVALYPLTMPKYNHKCFFTPEFKDSQRFLVVAGFYRRFFPNFASIAAPLTNLASPKTSFY